MVGPGRARRRKNFKSCGRKVKSAGAGLPVVLEEFVAYDHRERSQQGISGSSEIKPKASIGVPRAVGQLILGRGRPSSLWSRERA